MSLTGANIPPELFEYILERLTLSLELYIQPHNFVQAGKRELSRCAVVVLLNYRSTGTIAIPERRVLKSQQGNVA